MVCHGGVVGSSLLALLAPVLVTGIVIALAAQLPRWPAIERFEVRLGERIVRWHQPRTTALFGDLSALGSSTLVALVAAAAASIFFVRGEPQAALEVALAPAIAGPLGTLLKKLTRRTRPNEPVAVFFGSSMPSNHTLMATALYGVLAAALLAQLPEGDALRALVVAIAFW